MNKEISLVFDIDDTLYSQMEPLLTACEFSLGRALLDPELFYRIFGKKKRGNVSVQRERTGFYPRVQAVQN